MSQLDLFAEAVYDYAWRVQCTHHLVDRRTGEPYRWFHVADGEAHAHALAAKVERLHPGVRAEVGRR